MDHIKTATGKIFDSDYVSSIPSPPMMFVRICNKSLAEVAQVFSDRNETVQLWYNDELYFAHYTQLQALVPETGAIKVHLAKEV